MSRLTGIIEDMLTIARAKGKAYRPLGNGLHVKIESDTSGFILTIARKRQTPSMQEWQTILKYFPYDTGSVLPQLTRGEEWHTLTGKVPARSNEQIKFW